MGKTLPPLMGAFIWLGFSFAFAQSLKFSDDTPATTETTFGRETLSSWSQGPCERIAAYRKICETVGLTPAQILEASMLTTNSSKNSGITGCDEDRKALAKCL